MLVSGVQVQENMAVELRETNATIALSEPDHVCQEFEQGTAI